MDLRSLFGGIFGGANSTNSTGSNSRFSAPASTQSNQAPALTSPVPTDSCRNNGVTLAQAPQTSQAPQAKSPEAQIKSQFANLDPMQAQNLLMELKAALMGMLGMGSAPAAEKPAQAQLGPGQAPQAQLPAEAVDQLMAQLGQGQAPQPLGPQTLQAIDQVMAQLGQGQAPQANTPDRLNAILQNILNPAPQNGTPTAQVSSQQQPPVQLASQNTNKPAPTHAQTQPA